MKHIGIRIISCVVLMAVALTMVVFTLADFDRADDSYYLAPAGNYVGIYRAGEPDEPLKVTDIALAGLRKADREEILRGLTAPDLQKIQSLLEDLGS